MGLLHSGAAEGHQSRSAIEDLGQQAEFRLSSGLGPSNPSLRGKMREDALPSDGGGTVGVKFVETRLAGRQHKLVHDGPAAHTLPSVRETAFRMTGGTVDADGPTVAYPPIDQIAGNPLCIRIARQFAHCRRVSAQNLQ